MVDRSTNQPKQAQLKQECSIALAAFNLSLDEQAGALADLLVLKQDKESIVLRVQCLDEGQSKPFILKYRTANDKLVYFALTAKLEKLIRSEHSMLAWSETEGAKTIIPRRRRTTGGEPFWLSDQGLEPEIADQPVLPKGCWTVSEYLANGPAFNWLAVAPDWTNEQAKSAGELLAKLHCAGRHAKEKLTGAERHQLASLLPNLPDLIGRTFTDAADAYLHKTILDAVSALSSGTKSALSGAEELIVHGDFHPGNVLFAGQAAVAAIDLDYAHLEHPLYDLAYALLMYAPTADTADRAASFITGYGGHFESSAQEPPCLLPTVAQALASARGECTDAASMFEQYSVVAASLILLWTKSQPGLEHPESVPLAKRMLARIQAYSS